MVIKILAWGLGAVGVGLAAGAGSAASSHVGAEVVNRRLGYKKGEGPLTPKHQGIGLVVAPNSPSEAGQCIANLSSMKRFHMKYFSLTESEGAALEEMVPPVKALIEVRADITRSVLQLGMAMACGDELVKEEFDRLREKMTFIDTALEQACKPLARMLDSVPSRRRRHIPGA